jgi:hypothetical protein
MKRSEADKQEGAPKVAIPNPLDRSRKLPFAQRRPDVCLEWFYPRLRSQAEGSGRCSSLVEQHRSQNHRIVVLLVMRHRRA